MANKYHMKANYSEEKTQRKTALDSIKRGAKRNSDVKKAVSQLKSAGINARMTSGR